MHDSFGIPACFSSGERQTDEPAGVTRSGQSVLMSVYRTKLAGHCRLITVTWCKNLLLHGLSIAVLSTNGNERPHQCKVELKPWYFWKKQGSKQFVVDGRIVDVVWDLKAAKFNGEAEPRSDYYVAIVCEEEVVLLLGDLKKDAYRKTRCRPALIEPTLVSRKEHVSGKKKFSTRVKFSNEIKGKFHQISIECNNNTSRIDSNVVCAFDPQLEIKVDGEVAIQVKHLQWKFRGNESIHVSKNRVEVYWDVHDWIFGSGPRQGLFIFKQVSSLSPSSISAPSSPPSPPSLLLTNEEEISNLVEDDNAGGSSSFCLLLHAWKED